MTHKIDSTGTAAVATDYYWIRIDENTPRGVTMWLINKASGVGHKGSHDGVDKFFDHWFPLPIFTKDEK